MVPDCANLTSRTLQRITGASIRLDSGQPFFEDAGIDAVIDDRQ
jgi:hypothetical protein